MPVEHDGHRGSRGSLTYPGSRLAPSLPAFSGLFTTDAPLLLPYSRASGPFRGAPRALAVPQHLEDVRSLVGWAGSEGLPLVPRGAGTGMPGGNVGLGIAVDLTAGFRKRGEIDPDRGRLRVEAGVTAGEVARAAEASSLFFPPLPSSADRCTLGGMVANNAAGARSFKYGSVRDWILELEVVLADGEVVRLARGAPPKEARPADPLERVRRTLSPKWERLARHWPEVRKNSSGYALDRYLSSGDPAELFVGSEGTLGLITAVTLALIPAPRDRGAILLGVDSPEMLLRATEEARSAGASACEFLGRAFIEVARLEERPMAGSVAGDAFALLLLEVDGEPGEVEVGLERLRALARGTGRGSIEARTPRDRSWLWELRHAASPVIASAAKEGLVSMQFIEDSVVPPSRLPDYLEGIEEILGRSGTTAAIFGHAGDGHAHVNPLVDVRRPGWREEVRSILEATAGLVAELGGTLSGEHGDGRVRAPYLDHIWSPETVDSFRIVKETFDPGGILNPGVILPLPGQDPLEGLHSDDGRSSGPW